MAKKNTAFTSGMRGDEENDLDQADPEQEEEGPPDKEKRGGARAEKKRKDRRQQRDAYTSGMRGGEPAPAPGGKEDEE